MCQIYSDQDPHLFTSTTRSMRLNGLSTSIRLENVFWDVLGQIAADEGRTTAEFVSTLHSEVLFRRGEPANFTSILRSACILYLRRSTGTPQAIAAE